MSSLRVIVLAGALSLSGCATLNPYTTEGAADVALVRFVSNFEYLTVFEQADLSQCPVRVITRRIASMWSVGVGGDGEVSALTMHGTSAKKEPLVRERKVVAGQPLLMHLKATRISNIGVRGWECGLGVSFIPKAGEQYEVDFRALDNRCTVNVNRLSIYAPTGALARTPEAGSKFFRAIDSHYLCSPSKTGT